MKKVRFSSGRGVIVSDRIPDYFLHSCYQEEVYREMSQADIIVGKDEIGNICCAGRRVSEDYQQGGGKAL